ncbi:tRNA (adenosine(37)-N6)-threonylcarbamoyltransferase complex ATPase subunit type 1 TsaE [uncultured Microbacterium sp.]|uniref:tRNA (adenosine(37)-N6)-threonylcarbamoyltransferase complex ATPase subunit type 1 TsaE n=1 Tax=uncultured Microbacterium sp. TaxID=191216 RepID=UPI002607881B|nr:tRNA (adenosine(37)-N6)-threonylcarbamoyltransferase complex ATPase subunit type 1 TsaE [uncultured Microbacterium sp.]
MTGLDAFLGEREIASAEGMEMLGREIGAALAAGDLVVLTGPLGAGKTTLTRGIGEGLGVRGPIQSPTFVIARTHPSLVGGPSLVHVDAYRLGTDGELDDLDIDFARSVVIAEWAAPYAAAVADVWWEIEIDRGWSGTGLDTACGTGGSHIADMEDAAPRLVRISRRP